MDDAPAPGDEGVALDYRNGDAHVAVNVPGSDSAGVDNVGPPMADMPCPDSAGVDNVGPPVANMTGPAITGGNHNQNTGASADAGRGDADTISLLTHTTGITNNTGTAGGMGGGVGGDVAIAVRTVILQPKVRKQGLS